MTLPKLSLFEKTGSILNSLFISMFILSVKCLFVLTENTSPTQNLPEMCRLRFCNLCFLPGGVNRTRRQSSAAEARAPLQNLHLLPPLEGLLNYFYPVFMFVKYRLVPLRRSKL